MCFVGNEAHAVFKITGISNFSYIERTGVVGGAGGAALAAAYALSALGMKLSVDVSIDSGGQQC